MRSSLWAWNVSALFYARTYGPLAHALDEDLLRFLGPHGVRGKLVLDAGCGPGVVARKLVAAGARTVLCADVSAHMLDQLGDDPRLVPIRATLGPGSLPALIAAHAPEGLDLVLFKRSLYHAEPVAEQILREAAGGAGPDRDRRPRLTRSVTERCGSRSRSGDWPAPRGRSASGRRASAPP